MAQCEKLIGQVFGDVKILERNRVMRFTTICLRCQTKALAAYDTIRKIAKRRGRMKCLTCLDLTGRKVGIISVVRKLNSSKWQMKCPIGHQFEAFAGHIRLSLAKNLKIHCRDCKRAEIAARPKPKPHRTHGMTRTKTWWRWMYMRKRCRKGYSTVCKRWQKFENFFRDMGEAPHGMVIDRKRNTGGYSPGNCRWATPKQSTENRTNTVWIRFRGKRMRVQQFAALLGIKQYTVYARLTKGFSPKQIAVKYRKDHERGTVFGDVETLGG